MTDRQNEELDITSLTKERFTDLRMDLRKKQADYLGKVQAVLKSADAGTYLMVRVREDRSLGNFVTLLLGLAETLGLRKGITIDFDEAARTVLLGPREE